MATENRGFRRRGILFVFPALILLSGCQAFEKWRGNSNDADPLTGLPPRVAQDKRGVSLTSSYDNPANRTTPATLAGANRPGDDLRISDGRRDDRNAVQPTGWKGTGSEKPAPGSGTAQLRSPIASNTGSARPAAVGAGPGPRIGTFEDGQQFLMSRGVKWQRLETTGEGEWKFSCSIPSRPGSTSMKTYEARDRHGLIAMQFVIDQIVRDQQR